MQIDDEHGRITSPHTNHHATRQPDGTWRVSWLPGRTLDRNGAITAVTLAEDAELPDDLAAEDLAAELDLTLAEVRTALGGEPN